MDADQATHGFSPLKSTCHRNAAQFGRGDSKFGINLAFGNLFQPYVTGAYTDGGCDSWKQHSIVRDSFLARPAVRARRLRDPPPPTAAQDAEPPASSRVERRHGARIAALSLPCTATLPETPQLARWRESPDAGPRHPGTECQTSPPRVCGPNQGRCLLLLYLHGGRESPPPPPVRPMPLQRPTSCARQSSR